MGDRAWAGITFYEVPDEALQDVFGLLDEMYGMFPTDLDEGLILGEQYTVDEHTLGFCNDEVSTLVTNHPGLVVEAHQAPRYEWNGEVLMHTPELGTFLCDEDGMGEVIISDDIIEKVYKDLPHDRGAPVLASEFKAALDRATGAPWLEHFASLQRAFVALKPEEYTTIERPEPE